MKLLLVMIACMAASISFFSSSYWGSRSTKGTVDTGTPAKDRKSASLKKGRRR
jgi:hypothetical protein